MNTLEFILRLFTAFALGASIGFERQWRQKVPASNQYLSMSWLCSICSSIHSDRGDATGRIASYIVSGIGFLGGGVIMKDGLTVKRS